MGVAPEARVEKKSGIDSKIFALCFIYPLYDLQKFLPFFFPFIGRATNAPDGSSP
jgi:hypothetical protein